MSIKVAVRRKMGIGIVLADSIKSELASGEFKILKVLGPGAGRANCAGSSGVSGG